MYRYSWLITFEIFQIFFFWIEEWVGGVNCIQTFFGFLDFFYIYKVPKTAISVAVMEATLQKKKINTMWFLIIKQNTNNYDVHP